MFNPVAPYGYLLSDMYLFMADITNPDFLVKSCRTWIGLDITRFCEQQRQPSSRHAQKTVNRSPIAGGGEVRHNLHSSLSQHCDRVIHYTSQLKAAKSYETYNIHPYLSI